MLDLGQVEERKLAKMLVILADAEEGDNWKDATFQWTRLQPPIPGWCLPVTWFTEMGMPARGILTLAYTCDPNFELWDLRANLSTLTLAQYPREPDLTQHIEPNTTPSKTRALALIRNPPITWTFEQAPERAGRA